jgi:DNA polymerase-4
MERAIIHLNVADFAVAVERTVDRRLAGRPVIVAPPGTARAAVYDMSEEAFQCGVRKGMMVGRALRRCRDARVIPCRRERYERAMAALLKQALPYAPRIEPGGDDGHLFLDVTGTGRLFGPPMDVAWRIRKQTRSDLSLDPIWSVAPNKLVAKVATRLVKPAGEYIVAAGEEARFLAPLPLHLLPGLEIPDLLRCRDFNLTRVRQLADWDLHQLETGFRNRARFLHDTVRGVDPSPVRSVAEAPPRITGEHLFGEDTNQVPALEAALFTLVERAGRRLRKRRLAARRVAVCLDFSDGVRRIRQRRADPATANDLSLFETARFALHLADSRRVRVRRIQLICDRLTYPPAQLSLFEPDRQTSDRRTRLITALDRIRTRYGDHAVGFGRTLGPPPPARRPRAA